MDSPIKPQSKDTVNVFNACCDLCGLVRSRKGSFAAEALGRNRFICEACCERTKAVSYGDVFGPSAGSLSDVIFLRGGSRA